MSAKVHLAITAHDLDSLARLLASGHDPNEFCGVCVPLHNAVGEFDDGRDIEAVALLLRHGADQQKVPAKGAAKGANHFFSPPAPTQLPLPVTGSPPA